VSAQDVAAWSDPVPSLDELGAVHFVGIGGAGMSGIARILLARGVRVSGSDRRDTPTLLALRALGARVEVGHDPAHLGSGKDAADTVVVSTAIRPDNPELATARERGLRVLPRAVALAAVMAGRRSIAVAGTHGKTSTTSMLTVAVQACGVDPSFAIGGDLNESGSNAHAGEGDIFVAEADESDRSFLLLAPFGAIVTNVEADHLDNYGDLAAVEAAFDRFLGTVDEKGFVVVCADDPGAARLRGVATPGRLRTYGQAADADLQLTDLEVAPGATSYTATLDGQQLGRVEILVPGEHMALNSAAALLAGLELGLPARELIEGLGRFGGVHRRFELKGVVGGVRVYDDYAHHPTEVTAQLKAARAVAGSGRLVVAFQPHLYSRTREFAEGFGAALGLADDVVVMDVYGAREDPVPGVTGALVADVVPLPPGRVLFEPSWSAAAPALAARARPGDLVLTMGAGDVSMVGPEVLAALRAAGAGHGKGDPAGDGSEDRGR
jgi:UDP-N-acetylmuramate--alanine ligase